MQQMKFRLTLKAAAWELSIILFAIPVLGVSFLAGFFASELIRDNQVGAMRVALSVFFGLIAFVIGILSLCLILMAVGRAIFSYLLLSNEGLEYRLWPLHKVRCTWSDVERIKKSALPFQGDLLTLKNADVSGFQKNLLVFNKGNFGAFKTIPVIPLYQISGWKNGELKTELQKYAPHLFIEQPTT
jgi:hypothetical protein